MPILFQTISEQSQKHCQTSVIPSSAKPIVFARKIQPNWEFAPAVSRVTTRSFVTPTLPQPCTTHVLQHPRAEAGSLSLTPSTPTLSCRPPSTSHLRSPNSSQRSSPPSCSLVLPPGSEAEKRGESSREERREQDAVGDW